MTKKPRFYESEYAMKKEGKSIIPRAKIIYDSPVGAWRVDYLLGFVGGYREWSEWFTTRDEAFTAKQLFDATHSS